MMKSFILTVLPALMMAAEEVDVEAAEPPKEPQTCYQLGSGTFSRWDNAERRKECEDNIEAGSVGNCVVVDGSVYGFRCVTPKVYCQKQDKETCDQTKADCEWDEEEEECTLKNGGAPGPNPDNTDPDITDNTNPVNPDTTDNANKPVKPDVTEAPDSNADSNAVAMGLTLAGFLVILQL